MNIHNRIKLLQRFAQTPPPAPGTTTPTTAAPQIDIRQLPGFKPQLFAARPDLINDLGKLVNVLNTNLWKLSNGTVSFNFVYQNPTLNGDAFSNTLKNIVVVSKWLYSTLVASNQQPYTTDGLKGLGISIINMVKSQSFPEMPSLQSEIETIARAFLAKIA
jgi:hypothetical protein